MKIYIQPNEKSQRKPIDLYIRTCRGKFSNKLSSDSEQNRSSSAELGTYVSKEKLKETLNKFKEIANQKPEVKPVVK